MTSTPVMGSVGSPAANFLNPTPNATKTGGADFKNFMNQSAGNENAAANDVSTARNDRQDIKDKMNNQKPEQVKTTEPRNNVSDGNAEVKDDEIVSKAKDIINEVSSKIQDELSVTEEDIENALETLGLNFMALLDPEQLPLIVATLEGAEDTLAIVTDSDLYESLSNITDFAKAATGELSELLNIQPEELEAEIQKFEVLPEESDAFSNEADVEAMTEFVEEGKAETFEDKIEITVSRDARKNVVTTENVTDNQTETLQSVRPVKTDTDFGKQSGQNTGNPMMSFAERIIEQVTQSLNESSEVPTYTTFDVQNVLNQITDSIKADITAETSEISLRLHPESLGTVSVKVSANHEGILTAQFTAQNESVKAVIESQAIVLKQSLEEKGVTVEAVEVTVQSHEFERNLSDSNRGNNNGNGSKRRGLRRINLDETEETNENDEKLVREMMAQNGSTVDYSA